MCKRIYIAGAVTGVFGYQSHFAKAEEYLTSKYPDATIVNPVRIMEYLRAEQDNLTHTECMRVTLAAETTCNAIYLLNGWENSIGVNEEYALALNNEFEVFFENDT